MTVYTSDLLEDYYIDEDGTSNFVDANGETVIIAGLVDDPEPPPEMNFFGFLRMALWQ